MGAGIVTKHSSSAQQLSSYSDWAYTLCLTKNKGIKENIEKTCVGDKVTFVREPENVQDPNAIIVCTKVGKIGYLAGGTAEVLAPLLDEKRINYVAEVAEVIPYSKLENKRMNPVVRLYIEIEDHVSSQFINNSEQGSTVVIDMTGSTSSDFSVLESILGINDGDEENSRPESSDVDAAFQAYFDATEYERSLESEGISPVAEFIDNEFPLVSTKANQGDEYAIKLLEKMRAGFEDD